MKNQPFRALVGAICAAIFNLKLHGWFQRSKMLQHFVVGTSSALVFRSRNRKVKSEFSWLVRELFSATRGLRIEFQGSRVQKPRRAPGYSSLRELGFRVTDLFPESICCFLSS